MTQNEANNLILKYYESTFKLVLKYTRQKEIAEDILHDAIIKALMHCGQIVDPKKFRAWFCTIAMNCFRNDYKRGKWRKVEPFDETLGEVFAPEGDLVESLHKDSLLQRLAAHGATLPPRQAQAFKLRNTGKSFHEIAEVMGCEYDTAKANYRFAVSKMKH